MASQRAGGYLETFLEPVAPLWLSISPWRAMATPLMPQIIFWVNYSIHWITLEQSGLFIKIQICWYGITYFRVSGTTNQKIQPEIYMLVVVLPLKG